MEGDMRQVGDTLGCMSNFPAHGWFKLLELDAGQLLSSQKPHGTALCEEGIRSKVRLTR